VIFFFSLIFSSQRGLLNSYARSAYAENSRAVYISPRVMYPLIHHLDQATNQPTHRPPNQRPHRANLPAQHTHKRVKPCCAVCAHQTPQPSVPTKPVLSGLSTPPPPKAPPPRRDRLPGARQLPHPNLTHAPPSCLFSTRLHAPA
jgi:hypothetical protein